MFFIVRHEPMSRPDRVGPTTPRVPVILGTPFASRVAARAEARRRFERPWRIVEADELGQVIREVS